MAPRICLVLVAAITCAACSPPEPVRIGFLGGLSGRVADLGIGGRNGALLAIEQRNARGGLRGAPIELVAEDDRQDPSAAREAFQRLTERGVVAVVGPMTSMVAMEVVPLANQGRLTLVSPTVTTRALTGKDDYFLRVVAPTSAFARTHATYYADQLHVRRLAVAYDVRNKAYSESWLDDFRNVFEKDGRRIIETLSFSSNDEQMFGSLAPRLVAAKADGILIVANSVDAAVLCQQIRKLDQEVPLGISEWAGTERLLELGGRAVEGIVMAQFIERESKLPAYVAFRTAYVARFGAEPGFAGLTGFDAANVVLDALEKAPVGADLKQVILARATFGGAQSQIKFDAYGDTRRETFLTTVKHGHFVRLH